MKLRFILAKRSLRLAPAVCLAVLGPALFAASLIPGSGPGGATALDHTARKGPHRLDGSVKGPQLAERVKADLLRIAALVEGNL
jgi:hypothetical protein